jgi:transcriptional regulator with XRE-family HTH domain
MTLGEYLRELRGKKHWNLVALAERSGLNYQHLSRIENDSIVPAPDTVVRLADSLGGDLQLMLELADCLPKEILQRLAVRPTRGTMKRTAGADPIRPSRAPDARARSLAQQLGVPESEVDEVADAVVHLMTLDSRRRRAVVQLMRTFDGGVGGQR